MNRRARIVATLAAAASLATAAHAGAATWSPQVFPIPGTAGQTPTIAVNPRGDVAVAGGSADGVQLSVRPAGGTFEPVVKVGSGGAGVADVAMNAAGDVAVGWLSTGSVVHLAVRRHGGAFGTVQDFPNAAGAIQYASVAIDDAGETAFSWESTSGGKSIQNVVIRAPDGTLGPVTSTVSGQYVGGLYEVAMNPKGDAVVITSRSDGANYLATVATRAAGAPSFTAFTTLSAPGQSIGYPSAAIDRSGRVAVAWHRSDGANDRVQVAYQPAGGLFTQPTDASPPSTAADYPSIALTDAGEVLVSWSAGAQLVDVRSTAFGAAFTAPLQQLDGGSSRSSAALAPNGSGVVSFGSGTTARASTRPAAGAGFGTPLTAATDTGTLFTNVAGNPVGIADTGDVAMAISGATAAGTGVAVLDVTPPELRDLSVTPTAFSVTPWDAFSAVGAPHWDFGDGTGADGASVTHAYNKPGTYTVTVTATDAAGNTASATRTVVVPAPSVPAGQAPPATPPALKPPAKVATPVTCKVPKLTNLTTTRAKARLKAAHCALGKVTTPKRYKKRDGLVIRSQSPTKGTKKSGTRVNVTLGVKPKPKPKKTHKR